LKLLESCLLANFANCCLLLKFLVVSFAAKEVSTGLEILQVAHSCKLEVARVALVDYSLPGNILDFEGTLAE